MRSALADDRRRGAEAGKRPALKARSLFSAVIIVPRVCALPHRPPLYYAGGSGDVEGRRYLLSRAFRVQNTSFSFMILRANFAADAAKTTSDDLIAELCASQDTCNGEDKAASTQAPAGCSRQLPRAGRIANLLSPGPSLRIF